MYTAFPPLVAGTVGEQSLFVSGSLHKDASYCNTAMSHGGRCTWHRKLSKGESFIQKLRHLNTPLTHISTATTGNYVLASLRLLYPVTKVPAANIHGRFPTISSFNLHNYSK